MTSNDLSAVHQDLRREYVVYGTGGIATVLVEVMGSQGHTLVGAFDDYKAGHTFHGVIVQHCAELDQPPFNEIPVIVCLGDNMRRRDLVSTFKPPNLTPMHTSVEISPNATVGTGTMVFHGSIVQSYAEIGDYSIINTAASIDHHCRIGNYVHIAPHATLCGLVEVGEGTEIGAGAVVLPSVRIGSWCKIGAGAVVLKDVPDNSTAVGNPARVIKVDGIRVAS